LRRYTKVEGLKCTRPLAPTPAMSILWLRPASGGPNAAPDASELDITSSGGGGGRKKPSKQKVSGGVGGGGGDEEEVDPAVRAWAWAAQGYLVRRCRLNR